MRTSGFVHAAAAVALVALGATASAQDICADLQARLVALERRSDDGDQRLQSQIASQRRALDRAVAEARRMGCLGGLFLKPRGGARCGPLKAGITRMRANLTRLNAQRQGSSFEAFDGSRERADIVGLLNANRCSDPPSDAGGGGRPGLFASLFGGRPVRGGWGPNGFHFDNDYGLGTYRTLCVRMCDGYYFPISFSTVPANFAGDEQTCRATCPATAVELYVYRNPGEEVEMMVSLSGQAYTSLPTAFRYREKYDAGCRCQPPVPPLASGAEADILAPARTDPATSAPATPSAKLPPAAEDPETVANRAGGLAPKAASIKQPEPSVVGPSPDRKKIRIVGPSFYVAQ